MVGFRDRWRWLVDLLKSNADTLGVLPDSIVIGNWQDQSPALSLPGVIVYMVPGDLLTDTPMDRTATFKLFCLTDSIDSVEDAAGVAVELGWKVVDVIRKGSDGVLVRWPKDKVSLDTVTQTLTAARVEGLVEYDVR
jgi:hypothetical protein